MSGTNAHAAFHDRASSGNIHTVAINAKLVRPIRIGSNVRLWEIRHAETLSAAATMT